MFGIYRTILAIFVVLGHLGTAPYIGAYSVFGFYILSGYLMTRIMQKSYGYQLTGVLKYFINRFLRIYPLYWFSVFFSFLLILLFSEDFSTAINSAIYLPGETTELLKNIFIFLFIDIEPRLTPPAWALTVELFYYIMIALGFSKTKKIALTWFLLSSFYTIYLLLGQASFSYRYFTIQSASLPFSLGSLIFFISQEKKLKSPSINLAVTIFLLVFNYFFSLYLGTSDSYSFYINLFLISYLVLNLSLFNIKPLIKLDTFIGNLSYPIYLLHYQCGIIIYTIFSLYSFHYSKGDFIFFFTSLILCIFISYLTARSIEHKIELLRNKIRPKQQLQ
jgi:peptidoglycan/LPS O-acetylase OafA/YrhL